DVEIRVDERFICRECFGFEPGDAGSLRGKFPGIICYLLAQQLKRCLRILAAVAQVRLAIGVGERLWSEIRPRGVRSERDVHLGRSLAEPSGALQKLAERRLGFGRDTLLRSL